MANAFDGPPNLPEKDACNAFNAIGVDNLGARELRSVEGAGIADLLWENPGSRVVAWYMNSNGTVRGAGVGLGNIYIGTTTNKIMAVEEDFFPRHQRVVPRRSRGRYSSENSFVPIGCPERESNPHDLTLILK